MALLYDSTAPNPGAGHLCGATIIAPRLALTAGHCGDVLRYWGPDQPFKLLIGQNRLSETTGRSIGITGVVVHPDFKGIYFGLENDVAILRLAEDAGVTPVALATPADTALMAAGVSANVVGWGVQNLDGAVPDRLREGVVKLVSDATCDDSYGRSFDPVSSICAGFAAGGVDTCAGDSGGPMVVPDGAGGYTEIGVTSWGFGCAQPNEYGVYARVAALQAWITSNPPIAPMVDYSKADDQVRLTGDPWVGSTLTCLPGAWLGEGVAFSYAWSRDDEPVAGATSDAYGLTDADLGHVIGCEVTGSNASGSDFSGAVTGGPVTLPPDVIAPRVATVVITCVPKKCTIHGTTKDQGGSGVSSVEVIIRPVHACGTRFCARWFSMPVKADGTFRSRVLVRRGAKYRVSAWATDGAGNRQELATKRLVTVR